jgi:cell division septation protein DedD
MINPKTRIAAIVITIALALSGCSLVKNSSAPNDEAIVSSIQSKLFQDPVLKTRDVRVVSQKGVVVLSGTVGSDQEKSTVEQLAQKTDGVTQVIDQLAVNGSQQAEQAASQAPAQPERRAARRRSRAYADNQPAPEAPTPAPVVQAPPAPAQAQEAAAPPPPQPVVVSIPAGTVITVRLVDGIDSSVNKAGDEIAATVDSPVSDNGQIVIPRYAKARLRIISERNAGHIRGQSEVQVKLVSLTVDGQAYNVSSGIYQKMAASSRGKQSAERAGIGAAVGGIIGAIAGGGKGAAIGAGVGAGAGTGVQMATKAPPVKIPPESRIGFTLSQPLNVTVNP